MFRIILHDSQNNNRTGLGISRSLGDEKDFSVSRSPMPLVPPVDVTYAHDSDLTDKIIISVATGVSVYTLKPINSNTSVIVHACLRLAITFIS